MKEQLYTMKTALLATLEASRTWNNAALPIIRETRSTETC